MKEKLIKQLEKLFKDTKLDKTDFKSNYLPMINELNIKKEVDRLFI